jgi:hypothetical protein
MQIVENADDTKPISCMSLGAGRESPEISPAVGRQAGCLACNNHDENVSIVALRNVKLARGRRVNNLQ